MKVLGLSMQRFSTLGLVCVLLLLQACGFTLHNPKLSQQATIYISNNYNNPVFTQTLQHELQFMGLTSVDSDQANTAQYRLEIYNPTPNRIISNGRIAEVSLFQTLQYRLIDNKHPTDSEPVSIQGYEQFQHDIKQLNSNEPVYQQRLQENLARTLSRQVFAQITQTTK